MKPRKILLVEDDQAFNFLNRQVLKKNNIDCPVDVALNGRAALDYLNQGNECPDVILLDINMPVMDGFEFLEEFEKRNKCSKTSNVFILTSSTRDEDRAISMNSKHVKGYFYKPLGPVQIQEIMSKLAS